MTAGWLLRRLLRVVVTVAGIVLITFLLVHLAPGDPVLALAGEHGDPSYYAFIRQKFGLDRPLSDQLVTYVTNVVRGDLGTSFVQGRPVAEVVVERIPATLLLTAGALVFSAVAGVVLGTVSARRAGRPGDLGIRVFNLTGDVLPAFTLGQLAILWLAFRAGAFPVQGMTDARRSLSGLDYIADVAHHLALPVLVLGLGEIPIIARLVRVGLLETMEAEFVRTARAVGLGELRVLHNALRNVALPVTTVIGARVGMLFSGAVVVEVLFAWPGLGRLLLDSLQSRDHPVLLGIFLLVSLAVVLANLFTDLAYHRIDPRVRRA